MGCGSIRNIVKTYGSIIISLVALFVSILSYYTANRALEYEIGRNQLLDTPALVDISDSTEFKFSLNNDQAQLQTIKVTFPDEVLDYDFESFSKPLSFSTETLELFVKNCLYEYIQPRDSFALVGEVMIPVMIDYNTIVGSQSFFLREHRQLVFNIFSSTDQVSIKYNSSIMLPRPRIDLTEDPLSEHSRREVKRILNEEFQIAIGNLYTLRKRP